MRMWTCRRQRPYFFMGLIGLLRVGSHVDIEITLCRGGRDESAFVHLLVPNVLWCAMRVARAERTSVQCV